MSEFSAVTVLGVDVGTATTGWSIVESGLNSMQLIACGIISTKSTSPMPERLSEIYDNLNQIIDQYRPDQGAVESLFFFKNQKTVMTVSQARGVMLLSLQNKGVEIFEYTPLQVKSAISGYGRAEKSQVQEMVKKILNLKDIPKPDDAADAVAIAICHLNSSKNLNETY
jgi:crossover junction endodeoxyribonuclease RuvC